MMIDTDQIDASTPVAGCGCAMDGDFTVETVAPADSAVLTPGDPSPAGRCPNCDALVYIDTPASRAHDALDAVLQLARSKDWRPDDAAAIATTLARAITAAMGETMIQFHLEVERGNWSVKLEDPNGDDDWQAVVAADGPEAFAVAYGVDRARRLEPVGRDPETFAPDVFWDDGSGGYCVRAAQGPAGEDLHSFGGAMATLDDIISAAAPIDQAQAEAEGWTLETDDDDRRVIRAHGDTFANDNAARHYVVTRAADESPYHARAVAVAAFEE